MESFGCEQAVFGIDFDADKVAAQFSCGNRRRADAGKGVEYEVAGIRAGQYQFGQELFGLLGRVVGVFGHGPEGNGDVGPEIRGMCESKSTAAGFVPILWSAVIVSIGCHDLSFEFDGVEVEGVIVGYGCEPDVL